MRAWATGTTCTTSARVTGGGLARLARLLYRLRLLALSRHCAQPLTYRKLCRYFELYRLHTKALTGLFFPLQVQPALALPLLLPTIVTKATTCHAFTLALGKASLLQTWTHPPIFCLGGGRFKRTWFKGPGGTGQRPSRQVAVVHFGCLLATSYMQRVANCALCLSASTRVNLCTLEQPFKHKLCRQSACQSLRVAQLLHPECVPCGRGSGTTYTPFPFIGDAGHSLQCQHAAHMRRYSPLRCCRLRAWRTGVAESAFSFATWRSYPTRITILGHTWKVVLGYRTFPTDSVKTSHVRDVVGKWIATTVSTCKPRHILLVTGGVASAVGSTRSTSPFGYTTVHLSTSVETMCAGTTATSRTARMYRWSSALSTGVTCQTDAHPSRARTTSRRFLPMTTGPAHPGSLTSLTREHFCQGNRQLGLQHGARGTGTTPSHLR
eukprot:5564040-Amphidinium_carterae.1